MTNISKYLKKLVYFTLTKRFCHFPTLETAVSTVQEIVQYGLPIARIELLNAHQMEISINYSKLDHLESKPTLFYEFHGIETANK